MTSPEWSKTAISVHKFRHTVYKGFTTIDAAVARIYNMKQALPGKLVKLITN
jgi:hypothetical protein